MHKKECTGCGGVGKVAVPPKQRLPGERMQALADAILQVKRGREARQRYKDNLRLDLFDKALRSGT